MSKPTKKVQNTTSDTTFTDSTVFRNAGDVTVGAGSKASPEGNIDSDSEDNIEINNSDRNSSYVRSQVYANAGDVHVNSSGASTQKNTINAQNVMVIKNQAGSGGACKSRHIGDVLSGRFAIKVGGNIKKLHIHGNMEDNSCKAESSSDGRCFQDNSLNKLNEGTEHIGDILSGEFPLKVDGDIEEVKFMDTPEDNGEGIRKRGKNAGEPKDLNKAF